MKSTTKRDNVPVATPSAAAPPPEYIAELVTEARDAIVVAARKGARSSRQYAVLVLDVTDRISSGERVDDLLADNGSGRCTAVPITMDDALGIVSRTTRRLRSLYEERLAKTPPPGWVHTLVLSNVFGRLALLYAPTTPLRMEA